VLQPSQIVTVVYLLDRADPDVGLKFESGGLAALRAHQLDVAGVWIADGIANQ
jgi:hypothetical protein